MALEIQQSVNQMLSSAGVLTGLYAHSPETQKKRETKQKLKEIGAEKKQLGQEKEEVEFQLNTMSDKFVDIVEEADLTEDEKEELYKIKTPLEKQYESLGKREATLTKQEEYYNPKLRIERMTERSEKAKETTLNALLSYVKGRTDLETFKQKIGIKEKGGRK
jgi:hypothetical protein